MFRKTSVIVAIAGALGITSAHADVLGLLSTLSNIGKQLQRQAGPANSSSQPSNSSPVAGSPEDIMQMLADSSITQQQSTSCDPAFFHQEEQAALAKIKSGDLAGGGTDAKLNAEEIAVCAVKRNALPLVEAEQIAGENLAESAIALHHAGMDTPETIASAKNALTLLNVDASKNASLISALNSSGVLPVAPPTASSNADYTMTAAEAASQLMANNFAFNHRYGGKTLKIVGKVRAVTGGKNVFITMDGVPQADPGIDDQVTCTISNPADINAAMSISKGQKITVQGLYSVPTQSWMQAGVGLQDCHIVN
jgi:hypothetical protein